MPATEELLALALDYHRAGALAQAEPLYRQILQADPHHAGTLHLLGVLAAQTGHTDQAIDLFQQALRISPQAASFHNSLGNALRDQGRLDDAVRSYRQALALEPDYATAYHNLGAVLQKQRRWEDAIACYRQVLRLQPDVAEVHVELGNSLQGQGRLDEAAASYRQALRRQPQHPVVLNNLGNVLARQGQWAEAADCYQQALALQPGNATFHCNLGNVLRDQRKVEEAVSHFRIALRQRPDDAAAHNNLGNALIDQGKLDEAESHCRQALYLQPEFAQAHNNLGIALYQQGRLDEALAHSQRAVQLQPDCHEAHNNLGNVLKEQGNVAAAIASYRQALSYGPDDALAHNNLGNSLKDQGHLEEAMRCYREALRCQPDFAGAHSNLLYTLNMVPGLDPVAVFTEHCRWGQVHGAVSRLPPPPDRDRNPERRLRIGYVSPDLRRHPVNRYFEPVLAQHDPRQVEVFCYAQVRAPDAVTARLQSLGQGWRWTCGRSAAAVADQVRADGIDILVDLAGHTANHRLDVFTLKPAPVQVTWLGYPNTTGLGTVDYRLTDDVMDPPGQPVLDTEQLFRLPGGMCCFTTLEDAPPVAPLPALRKGQLTFGSLHGLHKLNGHVFDLWCRVLRAVPTARLLMFRDTLVGPTRDFIHRQFTERGIAGERLDLRQGTGAPGYLAIYDEIDVSLDVFPYTGGTTTGESFWMGAPMLSLAGVRPTARGSAMLLAIVGLDDWVVQTPDEYVALAQRCARDLDALAALRAGLRERMRGTLCDARRFTRGLEDAYRTMWRRWCAQQRGGSFDPDRR